MTYAMAIVRMLSSELR